jgi:hypothetical protein
MPLLEIIRVPIDFPSLTSSSSFDLQGFNKVSKIALAYPHTFSSVVEASFNKNVTYEPSIKTGNENCWFHSGEVEAPSIVAV